MDVGHHLYPKVCRAATVALLFACVRPDAAERTEAQAASAVEVSRIIDGYLAADPLTRPGRRGRCVLVPAFTDSDAGAVAGKAFGQLITDIDRVILVTTRQQPEPAVLLPAWESMRTALGSVSVDLETVRSAASRPGVASAGDEGRADQAMASVLPFLQQRLRQPFRLVPLDASASADPSLLSELLMPLVRQERTALVVVTAGTFAAGDLDVLFGSAEGAAGADTHAMPAPLLALRAIAFELGLRPVVTGLTSPAAGRVLLSAVLVEDANRVDLLTQATKAAWDDPLTQAAFQEAARAASRTNFQGDLLSQPEQVILLHLARSTILAKLKGEEPPAPPLYSDTLSRPAGCFVTLSQAGTLRGCLGTILPKDPLATTVQRYALAAAFEDKRFSPMTLEELARTDIEISVLTPPRKLEYRDGPDLLSKLEAGVHGVLITFEGGKRSTFLPQVWKQFPDKEELLRALCRKGAIPLDAWQDPAKTTVELYQSFDFREPPREP